MSAGIPTTWPTRLPRRAQLLVRKPLTPTGTVLLSFRVIDGERFYFHPGEFIAIDCDSPDWGYRRSPYCILSPPSTGNEFDLLIRVIPQGPVSLFLDQLVPGDIIGFRGPLGKSMLPQHPEEELILLGSGVGISPLYSLAAMVLPRGFRGKIRLFWGLRQKEDLCLLPELDALKQRFPNFAYFISLSQPPQDWTGLRGRITHSVPPLLDSLQNKRFYLVGNGAMIAEFGSALAEAGVSKIMIYEESFFNHKYKPELSIVAQIRSRLPASGQSSPLDFLKAVSFTD